MMRWFYVARAALQSLFARRTFEDQLSADLRFHLEQATAEYIREGLSPDEARRAALRAFGNPTYVLEEVRETSAWIWWERLAQDVRYGLRGFRRSPVFAATAVLSLALGIGANTAIFSVINTALLRELPVTDPEQLVLISNPETGDFAYPDYLALRDEARVFSDVAGASRTMPVNIGGGAEDERGSAKVVSGNYFAGLGVRSAIGRVFTTADESESVAVISHGYWHRRFGGSPDVLGQQIRLDGVPFVIVGVAPAGFFGESSGESPDFWTTVALQPPSRRTDRGYTWLNLIARLRSGVSLQQAEADVDAVLARLKPAWASTDTILHHVAVSPGARGVARMRRVFGAPLGVLMVIVGLVLLIACTNLGSLLVARGVARQGEIAMRLAIGANRARVVRQLITESVLLALAGGVLGLVFAMWLSRAMLRMVSSTLVAFGAPVVLSLDVGIDGRVLLFTAVVSLAAGALFGLAPALGAVGSQAGFILVDGGRHVVGRARRWSLRDAFIVAQIAFSLILLAGSAMFIRTLRNLEGQELGFPLQNRLQVSVAFERGYRPTLATLVPLLLERLRAIPGVDEASVAFTGALSNSGGGVYGLQIEGHPPRDKQDHRARADWVGPDYFRTVGIPLLAGRDFTLADTASAQKVVIVNETMAREFFNEGALGRRLTFNKNEHEIVGVAKDAKYTDLRAATPRVIFFPAVQTGTAFNVLEIRTSLEDPTSIASAVRSAVREVDPRLSALEAITLSERLDRKLMVEHLVADLAGVFSGLTLLLVSIGVYGTLAYTAARRTREIGVRLALGSRRGAVIWIMMREIVKRLGLGLLLGGIGVLLVGQLVRSMLFGLGPHDVPTIAMAVLLLSVVALFAGYIPTLRASRLDPASVLRE